MDDKSTQEIPEGSAFLDVSARHQDDCASQSRNQIQHLTKSVRQTYENLGTLLSLLDRMASCFWGCHGKEHVFEDLVGRAVSASLAALRLIEFGHYDEALALIRGIAEIGKPDVALLHQAGGIATLGRPSREGAPIALLSTGRSQGYRGSGKRGAA